MLRILIAPDKFKGGLTSFEVCQAIENGLRSASPDFEIRQLPQADGGDGLLDVITYYTAAQPRFSKVQDPLTRPLSACWLVSPDGKTAFIEMAKASGLQLLEPSEYNCQITTTYGTGQLIGEAIRSGVEEIVIGIGGSATNDGGIGMAAALGVRLLDKDGKEITPIGSSLVNLAKIDVAQKMAWPGIRFRVACDVKNPLCGEQGATRVYAPQKGADPAAVELLEAGMLNYARVLKKDLGIDLADRDGAGAAGGLGAGCLAFLGAELVSGVDLVMEYSDAARHIQQADIIITGEGKMDQQTLQGKLVAGIAALGRQNNRPVIALCGTLELSSAVLQNLGIDAAFSIINRPMSLDQAMQQSASLLEETAQHIGRLLRGWIDR